MCTSIAKGSEAIYRCSGTNACGVRACFDFSICCARDGHVFRVKQHVNRPCRVHPFCYASHDCCHTSPCERNRCGTPLMLMLLRSSSPNSLFVLLYLVL